MRWRLFSIDHGAGTRMLVFSRLLFYPCALALALLVMLEAQEAARLARSAAEMHTLAAAADGAWDKLLERLSFSWYSGAQERAATLARVTREAAEAHDRMVVYAAVAVAMAGLHLAWIARGPGHDRRRSARHANAVSAIALVLGVSLPMLTIVAGATVPLLGDVVLKYESKSILSAIGRLAGEGEWFLALAIAGFSVVLPVFKLGLLQVAAGTHSPRADAAARLLRLVGKWSMADVFVVAVLVAYLAAGADAHSRATVGAGLYFFGAYCLLSLLAGSIAAGSPASANKPA